MKNTRMNVYFKYKYIIDFVIFDRFLLRMVSSTDQYTVNRSQIYF